MTLALAPAWQEQTVYGYVTPATLRLLGEDPVLRLLKVTVKDAAGDPLADSSAPSSASPMSCSGPGTPWARSAFHPFSIRIRA